MLFRSVAVLSKRSNSRKRPNGLRPASSSAGLFASPCGAVPSFGGSPSLVDVVGPDLLSAAFVGVASSGVHSNGYSLVRKVVTNSGLTYASLSPFDQKQKLGDALLTPTRLYVKSGLAAIRTGGVKGLAHITGGGITDNLPRALPNALDAAIDLSAWQLPPVFAWLTREAGLEQAEMLRTFNCGLGLIVVASPDKAGQVIDAFGDNGERAVRIGELAMGSGPEPAVRYRGALS